MNKMNNKGFLLVESLVVSTFVLTILMFLYVQFNNLMINHKKSYTYNSVENIYNLGSFADFLKNTGQDETLKSNIDSRKYIVLYNGDTCTNLPDNTTIQVCDNLAHSMNLKYLIYTNSDIDDIKEYAKNTPDPNLTQDIRDFIIKIDAVKIEGKGRLIAKFGSTSDEANDRFSTVAINTNMNTVNVIYSFYKYNDLNIWRYSQSAAQDKSLDPSARSNFHIKSFNEGTGMNDIEVKTLSGSFENVYIPLTTTPGENYTLKFDYRTIETFSPLSGYTSVEAQILSHEPGNDDGSANKIKDVYLSNNSMNSPETIEITFTATGSVSYLTFNFGMAADNQIVKMSLGNFRLQKSLTNANATYGPQLNISGSMGWFTEKESGVQIMENTTRYIKENQTLYAR